MIEEVRSRLNACRNEFERNVQDSFGQKIRQDVYEPFDAELSAVERAIDEAHTEQQTIKNLLSTLRVII